ncbi:PEP-CTERM sorting domain-containing protein [Puniceicoccaceae bacterium K14]|nr:PEP-CTERM sorting domain-containing protein [Puniceicoccaceae bacterium K14]
MNVSVLNKGHRKVYALVAVALSFLTHSFAEEIVYTFSGNVNGSIYDSIADTDTPFSNENFALSFTADTDDIGPFANGFDILSGDVDFVLGANTFDITNNSSIFVNNDTSFLGFSDDDFFTDILFVVGSSLDTYDLSTPFGPVVLDGLVDEFVPLSTTTGEEISFFGNEFGPMTFSASLTTVPEPSTVVGVIGALGGLVYFHRRRKKC